MKERSPPVIDAEFEVIESPQPKLRWWRDYRLVIDWRVAALYSLPSLAALIAALTGRTH